MIWIYDHITIGVDGSKFKRVDFDREVAAAISAATESVEGLKHEDAPINEN